MSQEDGIDKIQRLRVSQGRFFGLLFRVNGGYVDQNFANTTPLSVRLALRISQRRTQQDTREQEQRLPQRLTAENLQLFFTAVREDDSHR